MNATDLERVIRSLVKSEFLFSATDLDERRRADDKAATSGLIEKTNFWYNLAMKGAIPVIESSFNVDIPSNQFRFKPSMQDFNVKEDELGTMILKLGMNMDAVAFRYVYSQPVFVGVKFADSLSLEVRRSLFESFDHQMLNCRSLTSSMKAGFGSVKMSVTGFILWVFTNQSEANAFSLIEKESLRKMHFWEKVNSLSWVVDLETNSITKHKGLPIILDSVFNVKAFENFLKVDKY
ncbi:hypothetical protein [Dolichospermum flos-aquae]|uniref:Uncharacterized protein n=1 Tax=Dolichospermum flos-aquae CCAP 1403/13F TaxID=315271 RepID=A0A6H2C0T7_DOLFA|nr:hypothetical protein [Dolichospermum flos-aquae]QJB44778.1 hypothetical protein HGD76_11975 [Dolichospermum flos-aquae CCAP 1403/13F]